MNGYGAHKLEATAPDPEGTPSRLGLVEAGLGLVEAGR